MKMFENFYTTSMSDGKKQLKIRFDKMRREVSAVARLMSLIAAAAVLCTTVMAMAGAAAANKKTADSIVIMYNGKEKGMINRPFISNGEVYVPLREALNCCGVENGDIAYDDGTVTVTFYTQLPEAKTVRASLEINRNGVTFDKDSEYRIMGISDESPDADMRRSTTHPAMLVDGATYIPVGMVLRLKNYYIARKYDDRVYLDLLNGLEIRLYGADGKYDALVSAPIDVNGANKYAPESYFAENERVVVGKAADFQDEKFEYTQINGYYFPTNTVKRIVTGDGGKVKAVIPCESFRHESVNPTGGGTSLWESVIRDREDSMFEKRGGFNVFMNEKAVHENGEEYNRCVDYCFIDYRYMVR